MLRIKAQGLTAGRRLQGSEDGYWQGSFLRCVQDGGLKLLKAMKGKRAPFIQSPVGDDVVVYCFQACLLFASRKGEELLQSGLSRACWCRKVVTSGAEEGVRKVIKQSVPWKAECGFKFVGFFHPRCCHVIVGKLKGRD